MGSLFWCQKRQSYGIVSTELRVELGKLEALPPLSAVTLALSLFLWRLGNRLMCVHAWPEKYALFPDSFHRFPLEAESEWVSRPHVGAWNQQQEACWRMKPWLLLLSSFCPLSYSCHCSRRLLWETHRDSEGHGASLALCPSASGGPDAHASQGSFRSNPGWS